MVDPQALFSIKLSLKVSILATLLVSVLGLPTAYLLSFKDFKLKNLLDALITLPLVFPPVVSGYLLLLLFGKRGVIGELLYKLFGWTVVFNWKGALIASAVAAFPIFVKGVKASFDSLDRSLIEASYTLGKGKVATFFKVILPISRPALIASLILSFARALGEFGATLMVAGNIPMRTNTIPLEIYSSVSAGEMERANFLVLFTALFSLAVIYLVNRFGERKVA